MTSSNPLTQSGKIRGLKWGLLIGGYFHKIINSAALYRLKTTLMLDFVDMSN